MKMNLVTRITVLHLVLIVLLVSVVIILSGGGSATSARTMTGDIAGEQVFVAAEMTDSAKALKEELIKSDQYVDNTVLEENDQFTITYFYSSDSFSVEVKGESYPLNKKTAEDWFTSKGFTGFDLCHLKIGFYSSISEIHLGLMKSDMVFEGCPVVETTPENIEFEAEI